MSKIIIYSSLFLSLLLSLSVTAKEEIKELNHKERVVAATAKLQNAPDTVTVFVKGLACPSCGIGIRKKLSKLPFVDKTRFNKGVELDQYVQLVSIAIKQGQKTDLPAIRKAVDDAGFIAEHLFRMKGKKLQAIALR